MLQEISFEIKNGKPIWGLLRANEYLEPKSALRLALVALAKTEIKIDNKALLEMVFAGETLNKISNSHLKIPTEKANKDRNIKKRFIPAKKISFNHRKSQLELLRKTG